MSEAKHLGILMSCLVDSLAKTSHRQENKTALPRTQEADYGLSYYELLGKLDQKSYSWKMLTTSQMWGEQPSLHHLPKQGMTVSGMIFKLPTLAHPIKDNGGSASLYPTPVASDYINRRAPKDENVHITKSGIVRLKNSRGGTSCVRLSQVIKYYTQKQDWHTVIGNDALKVGNIEQKRENGLSAQVKHYSDTPTLELNPTWVETGLMGLPPNWTNIEVAGQQDQMNHNTTMKHAV
ncbi:MAG: hypothetical protein AAFV93_22510 [Chloroflexota bacterium]